MSLPDQQIPVLAGVAARQKVIVMAWSSPVSH